LTLLASDKTSHFWIYYELRGKPPLNQGQQLKEHNGFIIKYGALYCALHEIKQDANIKPKNYFLFLTKTNSRWLITYNQEPRRSHQQLRPATHFPHRS
jgi:hypothetical protein